MNTILLRSPVTPVQLARLKKEFPHCRFIQEGKEQVTESEWPRIEVIRGDSLTVEELEKATQLRWIHASSHDLSALCLKEIKSLGNLFITCSPERNAVVNAEYVIACVLAFAKGLFGWKSALFEDDPVWSRKMWSLEGKIFLQIGLGQIGVEILKRAQNLGMKGWGMQRLRSFHPDVSKTLTDTELHSFLPMADVVSLCVPNAKRYQHWIGNKELSLMKNGSILAVLGSENVLDQQALIHFAQQEKFRGVILDCYCHPTLAQHPHTLATPCIASSLQSNDNEGFTIFRHNLWYCLQGDPQEMKGLIDWDIYITDGKK